MSLLLFLFDHFRLFLLWFFTLFHRLSIFRCVLGGRLFFSTFSIRRARFVRRRFNFFIIFNFDLNLNNILFLYGSFSLDKGSSATTTQLKLQRYLGFSQTFFFHFFCESGNPRNFVSLQFFFRSLRNLFNISIVQRTMNVLIMCESNRLLDTYLAICLENCSLLSPDFFTFDGCFFFIAGSQVFQRNSNWKGVDVDQTNLTDTEGRRNVGPVEGCPQSHTFV
mmetsp:Transcript_771/g.1721  ORF Transcript_771/g.1721 Transcript_771/m.1721 type:complete len:222 (+) Transcript_771:912-1577(+)